MSLQLVTDTALPELSGVERQEQLLDELARVLAHQVGEHPLPYELVLRANAIERQLAGLEAYR